MIDRHAQIASFLQVAGYEDATREIVAGDASNRRYLRLRRPGGQVAILMDAPPDKGEDVAPFVQIAGHLRNIGLSAPEIYAQNAAQGFLLLEDFGDALFADLMSSDPSQQTQLYRAAADVLLVLQDAPKMDLALCDSRWLVDMIEPAFEWYAQKTDPDSFETFKTAFAPFAETVTHTPNVMMLRDYHAQNLLLLPDRQGVQRVGLLDFQDAMLGHPAYDMASILQDARRDVSAEIEDSIINYVLAQTHHDETEFRLAYAVLGLQRNLRILGVFARLCLRDGKAHYVDFIPRVWRYIERNLRHPDLGGLSSQLQRILPQPTPEFLEHMKSKCPQ